jgi:hypothetical protein
MTRRMTSRFLSIARDDLQVIPLSATEWRVSDARYAGDDGRSVLGYIGESRGVYEVVEFSDPVRFSFFDTVDEALTHLAGTAARRLGPVPVSAA